MSLVPKKKASGVDNTSRRSWDKDEARKKAEEREKKDKEDEESVVDAKKRKRLERDPLHQGLIVARSELKAREYQVDLASRLGKTQVVGMNTPLSQQAGYYCSVCDCVLRDSQSYLDHINGKYHNRALGMNMVVERSSVDQVKQRLAAVKAAKEAAKAEDYVPDGFDVRVLQAQEEAEREKEERRERKKEKRRGGGGGEDRAAADGEDGGADADMMALMGFGGFNSTKQ